MTITVDKNWGADADGNRGIRMVEIELDKDDEPQIVEQINAFYEDNGYLPKYLDVKIYNDALDEPFEDTIECTDYVVAYDYPDVP